LIASAAWAATTWNGEVPTNWRFDLAVAGRDYDEAEQAIVADRDAVNADRQGDLLRLRGRIRESEGVWRGQIRAAAAGERPSFRPLYQLATLYADFGETEDAIRLVEPAPSDSLPPLDGHYLERAEFYAGIGRVDPAKALVAEFEERVGPGERRAPWLLASVARVQGEIALNEGRFVDAVEEFKAVFDQSGACATCGLARLAHAWDEFGRPDSAVAAYEQLLSIHPGRLNSDDARWLPQVYQRLGELYEARGDTTQAVQAYAAFVDLWKNADPELQPQVEEVRRRVEALAR
jgi:tetratricopeptide (TPR) repeat protein